MELPEPHFVTFSVVNGIDVFAANRYRELFIESIKYCQNEKGLSVYAWVIMTSQIHMIIGTSGNHDLVDVIRDLKRYTSRKIRLELEEHENDCRKGWMLWLFGRAGRKNSNNLDYQFWIQNNHPMRLSTDEMVDRQLQFIHLNPVQAGFVTQPEFWKWSSAVDYHCGKQSMIRVDLLT
jgi:putative transposase